MARAARTSLAGGMLIFLLLMYPEGESLPRAFDHFRAARGVLTCPDLPAGVRGRALNRALYELLLDEAAVTPRVEALRPSADWDLAWSRVAAKVLPQDVRASWFAAVHDVLPTNERLHSIAWARVDSPLCRRCGQLDSLLHRLAECGPGRRSIWRWTARRVADLAAVDVTTITPEVLIAPDLPIEDERREAATTWVLGTMVHFMVTSSDPDVGTFECYVKRWREEAVRLAPVQLEMLKNL